MLGVSIDEGKSFDEGEIYVSGVFKMLRRCKDCGKYISEIAFCEHEEARFLEFFRRVTGQQL